jgi:predicted nucleic acid-binding Zn ribbon protein
MSFNSGGKPPTGKKFRRPMRSHLTAGADVLQALLTNGKSQLGDGFLRWRLEREWSLVVGETIAAQTLPCSLERGILWVWVRHSTWMQQLWFFKDMIQSKVNGHLRSEHVKEVRFTLNRRAAHQSLDNRSTGSSTTNGSSGSES